MEALTPTRVLVFNAGSSTLKAALFEAHSEVPLFRQTVSWKNDDAGPVVASLLDQLHQKGLLKEDAAAVGHRVVHGGTRFRESVVLDSKALAELESLSVLAPLHNPPALKIIRAAQNALPHSRHVGVFDTAFFRDLPPEQTIYPLPYEWFEKWGVRRFGFHGISHADCFMRAAGLLKRDPSSVNAITCHLGSGCSLTAVRGGKAIATTMGFTPLDGVMMGTRPGAMDPGALLFVLRESGQDIAWLEEQLNRHAGLLGVSGISSDLRELEPLRTTHPRVRLALDLFVSSVRSAIGSLAVTLGRVDALAFTGGIGENATDIRQEILRGLEILGPLPTFVIPAREEFVIAQEAHRLVQKDAIP